MFVLTILAGIIGVGVIGAGLKAFEDYSSKHFGHRFFSWGAFVAWVAGLALACGGYYWWLHARSHGGDQLNGIALMVVGGTIVLGMYARNVRRTSLLVGVGGSLLQTTTFAALAYVGIIPLIFGIVCFVCLVFSGGVKPVYVINRRRWF